MVSGFILSYLEQLEPNQRFSSYPLKSSWDLLVLADWLDELGNQEASAFAKRLRKGGLRLGTLLDVVLKFGDRKERRAVSLFQRTIYGAFRPMVSRRAVVVSYRKITGLPPIMRSILIAMLNNT